METAQFYQGLTFLVWTTAVVLIIICGFVAKLLFDTSKFVRNLDDTTTMVKTELEPTLKDVKEITKTVNEMVQTTDAQMAKIRKITGMLADFTTLGISKASILTSSLAKGAMKGFWSVMKLFKK